MDNITEELRVRITVEDADARQSVQDFGENVEKLKGQLKKLVSDTKQSFSDMAVGMKRAKFDEIFDPRAIEEYKKKAEVSLQGVAKDAEYQGKVMKRALELQRRDWKQWSEEMATASRQVRDEIKQMEESIKRMSSQSKTSFKEAGEEMKKLGENAAVVDEAVSNLEGRGKQAGEGFDFLGMKIRGLGDIVSLVFGTSIALMAVNALKDLVRWLKEAAQMGVEFSRSVYTLSVSVRALQRRGLDITFEDSLKMAQEISDLFGTFSFPSMVEGIGQLQLLTRNANLTTDQMRDLAKVAGSLSVLLGKDFNEAAREIGLYLSSGYAESLQRAGIMVSKMTIEQEAMADGVFKSYRQLTDQQRALYGYQAIMRQATDTIADAAEWQEQLGGRIEKANAKIANSTLTIGRLLAPVSALWAEIKARIIQAVEGILQMYILFTKFTESAVLSWKHAVQEFLDGAISLSEIFGRVRELFFEDLSERVEETFSVADPINRELGDAVEAVDDGAMQLQEALSNLADVIVDEMIKGKQRIRDAEIDLFRDLEAIDRKEIDKLADLWDDYVSDREDKIAKAELRIAQEIEKYNLNREQIIRQYNQKIEDAQEKYRQKEEDAEEKFQEKLRQLRENFLLSLEDAVRARDAYQIARLKRKFQMDKGRLEREFEQEKEARKDAYEDQKRDLEQQREERLRTLKEEHDLRLKQIEDNKNAELDLLEKKYKEEEADQIEAFERQRRERQIRYDQELDDIEQQAVDRIEQMAQKLDEQGEMVKNKLKAEAGHWEDTFGGDGEIEQSIYHFFDLLDELEGRVSGLDLSNFKVAPEGITGGSQEWYDWQGAGGGSDLETYIVKAGDTLSAIAQKFKVTVDAIVKLNRLSDPDRIFPGQKLIIPKAQFAQGGTLIARKPTMALFGEAGAEVASFSPINRVGANENRVFGGYVPGGTSKGERHEVLVSLGQDLEGRLIDGALNEVSRVFVKVQKATRRR